MSLLTTITLICIKRVKKYFIKQLKDNYKFADSISEFCILCFFCRGENFARNHSNKYNLNMCNYVYSRALSKPFKQVLHNTELNLKFLLKNYVQLLGFTSVSICKLHITIFLKYYQTAFTFQIPHKQAKILYDTCNSIDCALVATGRS